MNAASSTCEQLFHVGGKFGVCGDKTFGVRGENVQNNGIFSTKNNIILQNT